MRIVLDTSVLIAAIRSPVGASAFILGQALRREITVLASVPLFLEYEAVATRPEHLLAAGCTLQTVQNLLDSLAGATEAVDIHILWRPQLHDADDEMVLETAVNGRADAILSFNVRDFLPSARKFGLEVLTPAEFLQKVRDGQQ